MSLDGRMSRRTLLQAAIAAAVPKLVHSTAQAQSPASPEKARELIGPLLANAEWQVPEKNSSEAAQQFYGLVTTHARYYSGERGRGHLHGGLQRLLDNNGEHLKIVLAAAKRYGVPKETAFLALAESHWSPFGENAAKAAGYWQFIPATAQIYGLQNVPVGAARQKARYTRQELEALGDERLDAAKSTDAAMRYLASLKRFFDKVAANHGLTITPHNAWTFAMWAYNRGPGHVRTTFIATKGDPLLYPKALLDQPIDNKKAAAKITAARRESASYVPKILAIREATHHFAKEPVVRPPKSQPKEIVPAEPAETQTGRESEEEVEIISYRVQGGDNLTKIATWISPDPDFVQMRMDQVRDYNERVLKRKLPDQVNRNERLFLPAQRVQVQTGDTLDKFARTYCSGWPVNVAVNHLRYVNGLRPGMQLQAGKTVIVPLQNE